MNVNIYASKFHLNRKELLRFKGTISKEPLIIEMGPLNLIKPLPFVLLYIDTYVSELGICHVLINCTVTIQYIHALLI